MHDWDLDMSQPPIPVGTRRMTVPALDTPVPVSPLALQQMRSIGNTWYAYQNHALDSAAAGSWRYLRCGTGCTLLEPPPTYPDFQGQEPGWKYVLMGQVDLGAGCIVPLKD